jgi:hypothetical protein
MTYMVSHDTEHAAALDFSSKPKGYDVQEALTHACKLLAEGKPNVAIQDGTGRRISGDDLVACCNGDKAISPDLFRAP